MKRYQQQPKYLRLESRTGCYLVYLHAIPFQCCRAWELLFDHRATWEMFEVYLEEKEG